MNSVEIAKQKLKDSDWSVLSDVDATLQNKQEFIEYRAALRVIVINDLECALIPDAPTPIWSQLTPNIEGTY